MQNYQYVTWEKGAVAAALPLPSSLPFYFPFLCFPNFFVGLEQAVANYFANPLALCHVQDPPLLSPCTASFQALSVNAFR